MQGQGAPLGSTHGLGGGWQGRLGAGWAGSGDMWRRAALDQQAAKQAGARLVTCVGIPLAGFKTCIEQLPPSMPATKPCATGMRQAPILPKSGERNIQPLQVRMRGRQSELCTAQLPLRHRPGRP